MILKKVISGGQTGADQIGIEEAASLGIRTGGTMPLGFKTEDGPRPEWAKKYGLIQCISGDYRFRTEINVADSSATVWFGYINTPGFKATFDACKRMKRKFYVNPTSEEMRKLADAHNIINIAGNRISKNPKVGEAVRAAFAGLKS